MDSKDHSEEPAKNRNRLDRRKCAFLLKSCIPSTESFDIIKRIYVIVKRIYDWITKNPLALWISRNPLALWISKNPLALITTVTLITVLFSLNFSTVYFSEVNIDTYGPVNTSAKWDYEFYNANPFEPTHWAFCNIDIRNRERNFSLSDYEGISFYIKGQKERKNVIFNILTQDRINADSNTVIWIENQYTTGKNISASTYWKKIYISFANLVKMNTQERLKEADLNKVFAMGFTVNYEPAFIHTREKNLIWIDEVKLIPKNNIQSEPKSFSNFTTLNVSIDGIDGIWHSGTGSL